MDPRIERTRARVLAAAHTLLLEVGFDRVTVDLVSERSGVARSTLYRHWQTKDEILRDAFTAVATEPVGGGADDPGGPRPGSGADRLATYAAAFADGLVHVWGRAAVTLAVGALEDPARRSVQQTFVDGYTRDIRELVHGSRAAGEIPGGADVEEVVECIVDLVVAPLFYRFLFARPATGAQARRLAADAWRQVAQMIVRP